MTEKSTRSRAEESYASTSERANDELRLLQRALSSIQSGVMITDATASDDPLVFVNHAFERITGYTSEEVLGNNPRFLQDDDKDQPALDDLRAARASDNDNIEWTGVLSNYKKDGTPFWSELSTAAVHGEDGRATHHIGVMSDVTEREETRETLRLSEGRFRSLVQNASDLITVVDAGGTITYESPSKERILGYGPQELVGRPVLEHVHPDDLEQVSVELGNVLSRPGYLSEEPAEFWYRHADGTWRYLESLAMNLLEDPGVGSLVITSRDVTERKLAEEKLTEAEERYRTLVERVPAIIYIHEPTPAHQSYDYEVSYISPRVEEVLGYKPHEFVNNRALWNGIIHPDDRARVLAEDERTDESGDPFLMEFRMVARDGRVVWIREEAILILGPEGEPLYWQGVMIDITEQKLADEKLRETEALFRGAFEDAAIGMTLADPESKRYLRVNQSWCDMLGYSEEELLAKTFPDLTHPEDLEATTDFARRVLAGEIDSYQHEKRYVHADGHEVWALTSVSLVRDVQGSPLYSVAQMQDITERKRAEVELKANHDLLHSIMEGTTDSVFVKDLQGRYLMINQAGAEVLGKSVEEVIGKDDTELFAAEGVREVMEEDREILAAGATRTTEDTKTADGQTHTFLSTKGPYRDGEGNVAGLFGVARDITDRKIAEEALRESEQRLQTIASNLPVITFALDSEGVFTFENGAALKTLGLEAGWSIGHSVFQIYAEFPDVLENVRRALAGEEVVATVEIESMTFHAIYTPQKSACGEVEGVIGVATNITERRRLEQELEYRATHDPLTRLANRDLLFDRLSQALQHASRHKEPVSMLYLDLNGFKEVNDRHGHETGDALLEAVTGRIERCLRPSDTAARMGGDEFIVLLEGMEAEKAGEVVRRVEAAFESPFAIGEREIRIGASVGLAYTGTGEKDAAQLLREADKEMYRAKRASRDSDAESVQED